MNSGFSSFLQPQDQRDEGSVQHLIRAQGNTPVINQVPDVHAAIPTVQRVVGHPEISPNSHSNGVRGNIRYKGSYKVNLPSSFERANYRAKKVVGQKNARVPSHGNAHFAPRRPVPHSLTRSPASFLERLVTLKSSFINKIAKLGDVKL